MKHVSQIQLEFLKLAIPYPLGIHNLDHHDPSDNSKSKVLVENDLGIDLTHPIMYNDYDDPNIKRFNNFYDAAYGSWTYPDPDTEQIIMNMPNRLFGLGAPADFDHDDYDDVAHEYHQVRDQ